MWSLLLRQGIFFSCVLITSASDPVDPTYNRFRQKIPRIGRRGEGIAAEYMDSDSFPHEGSLSNFFLKSSKAVPRLGRRNSEHSTTFNKLAAIATLMEEVGARHPSTNRFTYFLNDGDHKGRNLGADSGQIEEKHMDVLEQEDNETEKTDQRRTNSLWNPAALAFNSNDVQRLLTTWKLSTKENIYED